MHTSGTCAGERYHYQVSAQNKSFEDCPTNHLRKRQLLFILWQKKSIKTKSPVADFLTLWREREREIPHPLQFLHHHRKLLIFPPLPEVNWIQCPLQLHHKLPLMSAMARMSNQNVSGCGNKSQDKIKIKMRYMNRKHFCLQETQKTQCYTLLEQQTHEGNTQLWNQRIQGTTWTWNRMSWKKEKEKWIQRSKLHDYTQNRQVCTIGLCFYTEHFIYKSKETRVRNCRQRSH